MDTQTWTIIGIVVNLGAALGTFGLAYFAYAGPGNANKQLLFLKTQLKVMKSQVDPYLQISDVSFDGNKISFNIENIGVGNAQDIMVLSRYQPVTLTNIAPESDSFHDSAKLILQFKDVYELEQKLQITKWNELFNEGKLKEIYPRLWFQTNTERLNDLDIYGNYEIKPGGRVTYGETKYTNLVIPQKDALQFICEPLFNATYLYPKKSIISRFTRKTTYEGLPAYRGFNIDGLIGIMKNNKVSFLNLSFYLQYKNKFENPLESVFLENFVFSIKEHSNLQNAF